MKDEIVIVGTGTFAEIVAEYFHKYNAGQVVALSCSPELKTESIGFNGLPILDFDELLVRFPPQTVRLFVAIGYRKMNSVRENIFNQMLGLGYEFVSFIHPSVELWDSCKIGRNCFIFEDNTLQPFTAIGDNTILWSGNHLGHHSSIGSHSFISSHVVISGSCQIGNNVFVGVNASFHDGVTVGDRSLVGAAAIVGKDIGPDSVVSPIRTSLSSRKSFEVDF